MMFLSVLNCAPVLLAMLVNVGYERPLDTVEDVLKSSKSFAVAGNTYIPYYLKSSPRPSDRKLAEKFILYNMTLKIPKWIQDK